MLKTVRQKELLSILEKDGYLSTANAADHFAVSIATIRRDLDDLEQQGLLKKNYGGAERCLNPEVSAALVSSFQSRQQTFHEAKVAIAAQALKYIPDYSTIALDAGSTIYELCLLLGARKDLIVICGDIHSAQAVLASHNRAYMMGGFLTSYGTSSGDFAREFVDRINGIDYFLCSADCAHPDEGLSNNEIGINEYKKCFIKKANKTIALLDHSKFNRKAFYKMCSFTDIDLLITDSQTPPNIIDHIRSGGTEVEIAPCGQNKNAHDPT